MFLKSNIFLFFSDSVPWIKKTCQWQFRNFWHLICVNLNGSNQHEQKDIQLFHFKFLQVRIVRRPICFFWCFHEKWYSCKQLSQSLLWNNFFCLNSCFAHQFFLSSNDLDPRPKFEVLFSASFFWNVLLLFKLRGSRASYCCWTSTSGVVSRVQKLKSLSIS